MYSVQFLNSNLEDQYERFILSKEFTLLYHSNNYRCFLREFLKCEDKYFVCTNNNNEITGVLPSFIMKNSFGNVINSLPFYGSNGGIISSGNCIEIEESLMNAFVRYSKNNSVSSTIVTSPFSSDNQILINSSYTYTDKRISQITKLNCADGINIFERLHQKTRQNIRKAQKSVIHIEKHNDISALKFISDTHSENMKSIGGISKPGKFFNLIPKYFKEGKDYNIYIAKKNGSPISGLLLFYYNKTVEYFTPVIRPEYKALQPLSLLIYNAMLDAISLGYENWNWGGTWLTQKGVYEFKKKWATTEREYSYFNYIFDDSLVKKKPQFFLTNYPYFYVIPFNRLEI